MKVLVVGGGVIGLSTAIRLREAGWDVRIQADRLSPQTTSDVAAAIWYPYKAGPVEKVREWGEITYREFLSLLDEPAAGVHLTPGRKYFHRRMGFPWWQGFVRGFRIVPREELPPGIRTGYEMELPVVEMPRYLSYLKERFLASGGAIELRRLERVEDAFDEAPLVVLCTGLGSRELLSDPEVYPIRGQVVRLEGVASGRFLMDSDHPAGMIYIIPRSRDTILGGVADLEREDLTEDPVQTREILERCRLVSPDLTPLAVQGVRVGLRPGRTEIRLEREDHPRGTLIHNYGHGGSGVTLSWGCAREVVRLAGPPGSL